MDIVFPGGLRVDALVGGHHVPTDQPSAPGVRGSAPSPFDLFLASIGTCAGYYALRFCQERGLATDGMRLTLTTERDATAKRIQSIRLELELPRAFPEKYREAILRAVDQCTVKRHLVDPPEVEIGIQSAVPAAAAS